MSSLTTDGSDNVALLSTSRARGLGAHHYPARAQKHWEQRGREHACPCIYVARSRYLLARWRGAGWFLLGFWRGHDCRGGGRQARAVSPQLHARKKRDTAAAHLRLRALRWVGMTGDKCAERGRRDTNRQGNRKSQSRHKLPTQWLANHEPPGGLADPPDLPLPCTANCTRRLRASPLYPYYPSRHSPYSLVALISSLHATQLGRRRSSMYDNYQQELSSRDAHTYVYVYVSLLNGHRLSAMQSLRGPHAWPVRTWFAGCST